jgi:hypothetical protein
MLKRGGWFWTIYFDQKKDILMVKNSFKKIRKGKVITIQGGSGFS